MIRALFFLAALPGAVVDSWVMPLPVPLVSLCRHEYGGQTDARRTASWRRPSCASFSSTALQSTTIDSAPVNANTLVRNGMNAFRAGRVDESIRLFNQAEAIQGPSLTPYLWQRGLSYYYVNDFDAASRQFRTDVQVNPYDVEEIVWDIASQLRRQQALESSPQPFPVPNQLALPVGSKDRRKIMSTVYRLFRGEGTEHELAKAGHDAGVGSPDEFYALYYLGLYCEARGLPVKAEAYLRQAASTRYAQQSGDYMAACAKVHCQLRGWT